MEDSLDRIRAGRAGAAGGRASTVRLADPPTAEEIRAVPLPRAAAAEPLPTAAVAGKLAARAETAFDWT